MSIMTRQKGFIPLWIAVTACIIAVGSCTARSTGQSSFRAVGAPALTSRAEASSESLSPLAKGDDNTTGGNPVSLPSGVYAADLNTSPSLQAKAPASKISLQDVLRLTLENNLDIKITDYDRKIARDEIQVQKGIFDTLFTSRVAQTEIEQPLVLEDVTSIPGFTGATLESFGIARVQESITKLFEASLSQLIPTGGLLELTYTDERFENIPSGFATVSPYYTAQLTLAFLQPLLRNFGPAVTNAGIRIAKNSASISEEAFRLQVMNQLASALKTYWELVFAIYNYDVQMVSLRQAQDLLRINRAKFEAGVVPSTDVLLARAQVALREEQIITANQQILNVQDLLKQIMNVPKDDPNWQINIIPEDRPEYHDVHLKENQLLREAFSFRPEYRQAKTLLENHKIQRMVARNGRLPELNLYGYYGFTGADESNTLAFEDMETLDYHHWQVGLEFRYPLPNRVGRYRYHQSQLQYDQASESLENLKNLITLEIRTTQREVETNRKRIDVTKTSVEYEEAKLDAEQKRFNVGMATSLDVLEFQRDLANSRANHLRAIIDYNKALIDLEISKGTFLGSYQIQIENQ